MAARNVTLFSLVMLTVGGTALTAEVPVAVSPGHASMVAVVEGRCPTFSWGAVDGAESYELAVYRVDDETEEAKPVLRRRITGSALSWTPSLESCLLRGGQYAWNVRAVGNGKESEWSRLRFFQVASGLSEAEVEAALQIVRQYFAEADVEVSPDGGGLAPGEAQSSRPASSGLQVSDPPAPLASAAGDSDLMVNGAAVVTAATFGGAIAAINLECPGGWANRYTECGNGTVRDNNTGLFWLKDASCDALGPDSNGSGNWQEALDAAEALADGTCGLSDGSAAGVWRLPTVREFCSAWSGSTLFPCPASAAPDSLIDSTVATCPNIPTPHPFDGVVCTIYWSSTTPVLGDTAWVGNLNSASSVYVFGQTGDGVYIWPVRGAL